MVRKFIEILAAKFARTRERNLTQRLSDLENGQAQLNHMIQEFMSETEKVIEELSRLLRESQDAAALHPAPSVDLMKPAKSAGRIDAKYHIVQLSRQGKRAEEIASQLGIPTGEVQLILSLHRDGSKTAVAK